MDLKINNVSKEVLKLISELDLFKGSWTATKLIAPERLATLKHVATIESIGSSTRIEGVKLTDTEVEKLLQGIKLHHFKSRDEEEVAGYADLMNLIFESWGEINLTENNIKQFHGVLLKYSKKDERHKGEYKKLSNHVEAFGADGKSLGVIFQTTSPFDTPKEMKELVDWTNNELSQKDLHPLIIISCFIVAFLKIHPFQDGNGRLSRALTNLLLLKTGYSYVPYSSLEKIVEDNKDKYYISLRTAQSSMDGNKSKLGVWVTFFLKCMVQQKRVLESKIEGEKLVQALPDLSISILKAVKKRGRSSVSEIVALTKANRNTIKLHIKNLVAQGFLQKEGVGKGSKYRAG